MSLGRTVLAKYDRYGDFVRQVTGAPWPREPTLVRCHSLMFEAIDGLTLQDELQCWEFVGGH